jgi:rhodanese-related sulfurtransferase
MTNSSVPVRFASAQISPDGIPEVSPEETLALKDSLVIIDVRRPEEYTGDLGHIDGARLVTLETDFVRTLESLDRAQTHVFVCKVGGRSAQATAYARSKGLVHAFNLQGGMMLWNARKLPVVR